jgi:hypothetical protein
LWVSFGHVSFIFYPTPDNLTFNIAYWIGGIGISHWCSLPFIKRIFFKLFGGFGIKLYFLLIPTITWLTLPLFYFLLFTPFALLLRAVGKADMKNSIRICQATGKIPINQALRNNTFANFNYEKKIKKTLKKLRKKKEAQVSFIKNLCSC